jgi:hypothetical protein
MDRIVDMLQRVGVEDDVERCVAIGQAMNVYLRVGGKNMPVQTTEDGAEVAGFVDFKNGLRRPILDNFLQPFVVKVRSDRIAKRD